MDGVGRVDARRRAEALQRTAPRAGLDLATHADADLARPRARRPGLAHGISDHPAARRLRTHRPRPLAARAGQGARPVGAPQPPRDPGGAGALRYRRGTPERINCQSYDGDRTANRCERLHARTSDVSRHLRTVMVPTPSHPRREVVSIADADG